MSSDFPPNPFGNQSDPKFNPYGSPQAGGMNMGFPNMVQQVKGKVLAPAIFLCAVGALGLVFSLISIVMATVMDAPVVDPNAPEWMKDFQQNQRGPVAALIQGAFFLVNIIIIAGAVQMMRIKMRPFGYVAAVLAIVNFGSCCCILGIPAGIWSLIVLSLSDVAKAFEQNSSS